MSAPADDAILDRLPHRDPFRFLSEVTHLAAGVGGAASWRVTGNEAFFAGHFPGRPLVPGVLIAEALAQLSGLVAFGDASAATLARTAVLAHVDVRFDLAVAPPAVLELSSTLTRSLGNLYLFDVSARLGDDVVARGSLALSAPGGPQA